MSPVEHIVDFYADDTRFTWSDYKIGPHNNDYKAVTLHLTLRVNKTNVSFKSLLLLQGKLKEFLELPYTLLANTAF